MLSFGATILPDPPCSRFVELVQLAEQCGFDNAWTYDSHVLWQDGSVFLPAALAATERIRLGFCVTNPGTREPTVSASYHATLNDMYPGRDRARHRPRRLGAAHDRLRPGHGRRVRAARRR